MQTCNRTFRVVAFDDHAQTSNIDLPSDDTVEVMDLTTRALLHIKASDVSIYRHTLYWHGKKFNIMDVCDSTPHPATSKK
ncbi:MAG: hypothetical protein JSS58_01285 [Proteobacteria bacterium]|nr:hypothetical protein [Pseudomonadota bacterium]